jgi:hypothetical protein
MQEYNRNLLHRASCISVTFAHLQEYGASAPVIIKPLPPTPPPMPYQQAPQVANGGMMYDPFQQAAISYEMHRQMQEGGVEGEE